MSKATILLVEDHKAQATIIKAFLEKNDYKVIWVEEGMAAFKIAETEALDIILLDRMLPDIDGSEISRWLKLDPNTRSIPIIMLTAKDAVADKVSGLEAGADDYLPKPFNENELNARICVHLKTKSHQDELRQKNRRLEDMLTKVESLAIMDSLTGLYNRRRFETILTNEVKRAMRYQSPLSCMIIDVDQFKKVNDARGRQEGDAVLREIARRIQSSIREVDTVCRWGGEEFTILSPNTPIENAKTAATRILKAVSQHAFSGFSKEQITVSVGIASLPAPSIDSQDKLVHAADLALYEAKKNGRNQVALSS